MQGAFRRLIPLAALAALTALAATTLPTAAAAEMRLQLADGRLTLVGEFVQGGLLRGRAPPGSRLEFAGRAVRVAADGLFALGFHRDDPPEMMLRAVFPDGRTASAALPVAQRSYDIQHIDGLPPAQVSPPPELLQRIRREAALVKAARARDSDADGFANGFDWPAAGRISGVYGSQRVLNGAPRQPHYGLDIAAPVGTEVRAPAPGVVVLAQPDLYYSGGTLLLDHGHGVMSAFLHLSALAAKEGDFVPRGGLLGRVGDTGRASGPHLDWRVNWFGSRLDPALLMPPGPPPAIE